MQTANFTFSSPKSQQFSLPSTFIYRILQHSSAIFYEKLNQCCKYFYAKRKLLIVKNGQFRDSKWPNPSSKFDITNLQNCKAKLWFTGNLVIFDTNYFLNYMIVAKIYRSDITSLALQSQYLSFNNFYILTSNKKLQHLSMMNSMIFDGKTNKIIPVDEIYKLLPNVENFYFTKPTNLHFEILTTETFINLLCLTKPDSSISFKLENFALPPFFDPQAFLAFILSAAASGAVFTFNVKFDSRLQEIEFLGAADSFIEKWSDESRKKPIINIRTNFY